MFDPDRIKLFKTQYKDDKFYLEDNEYVDDLVHLANAKYKFLCFNIINCSIKVHKSFKGFRYNICYAYPEELKRFGEYPTIIYSGDEEYYGANGSILMKKKDFIKWKLIS